VLLISIPAQTLPLAKAAESCLSGQEIRYVSISRDGVTWQGTYRTNYPLKIDEVLVFDQNGTNEAMPTQGASATGSAGGPSFLGPSLAVDGNSSSRIVMDKS